MPRKVARTRAGDTWTESRFWTFIRGGIRSLTAKWPPKFHVLNDGARKYTGTDKRIKKENTCQTCNEWFPLTTLQIDHITACGSLKCWDDVVPFFKRALVEKEGLQRICKQCHKTIKTVNDMKIVKETASIRVLYPYEEASYRNMISRCYNPNSTGYSYYGGRGIKVSSDWVDSFYNFYKDMGQRPDKTSLDRIDVNGDYCIENCRWADFTTQARNSRGNTPITYRDETKLICEWAEQLGIKENTITYRILRGWSVAEALEKEPRAKPIYSGRMTDGDLLFIKTELEQGTSMRNIGKLLEIDESQISRVADKLGIKKLKKTAKERSKEE